MVKDFEAILDSNSSHSLKWLSKALLVSLPHIRPSLVLHPIQNEQILQSLPRKGSSLSGSLVQPVLVIKSIYNSVITSKIHFIIYLIFFLADRVGVFVESTTSHWEVVLLSFPLESVSVSMFFKELVQFTSVFKFIASDIICTISIISWPPFPWVCQFYYSLSRTTLGLLIVTLL